MPGARSTRRSRKPQRYFSVVAIGCSAGGLEALKLVLAPLGADFPCSIVIVQHLAPRHKSALSELLGKHTRLKVKQAEHGEPLRPGVVYLAPPDEHLLVGPGRLQLAHTQLVHFLRPSIDLMFESVAGTYGAAAVGVVLSGNLRDGAAGLRVIKDAGGTTVAQDPATAQFPSMPRAAIGTGCVDYVVPVEEMGAALARLCGMEAPA